MYIAIIPARGGSKGLPRKNIIDLMGKPLIAHSIAAAKMVPIDSVIVSSDSDEILSISSRFDAQPILRPAELAEDMTPTAPVIEHAVKALNLSVDPTIILLQPTSPLRNEEHIRGAIAQFESSDCDGLISVYEMVKTPFKAYVQGGDGKLSGLVSNEAPYTPRQQLPKAFYPNGAIYIFNWSKFLAYGGIPSRNLIGYLMSEDESIDIDSIADLRRAEQILRGIDES